MIRHEGGKWVLYSKDGARKLGSFDTKEQALEREREISAIKHVKQGYNEMPLDRVAEYVRVQLARANMTAEDLAKKAGVPVEEIVKLTTGEAYPNSDVIAKISGYLGCSPADLAYMHTNMYAEVKNVEIFATGNHEGENFSAEDLDEIVANFTAFSGEISPPMVLGHDEESPIVKNSGLPALGWATGVRRVGSKLHCDFSDVPELMKKALEAKRYKRVSVGLYTDYKGKGLTLRHVGVLGADIPAVKNLQDILALDKPELIAAGELASSQHDGFTSYFAEADIPSSNTVKENEMTKEELDKVMADQQAKFAEALAAQKKSAEEVAAAQKKAFDEKMAASEARIQGLTETLAASEVEKRRVSLEGFVKGLSEAGHLPPRLLEGAVAFMERLDGATVIKFSENRNETPLAYFQSFLKQLPQIVRLGEENLLTSGGAGGPAPKFHGAEHAVSGTSSELHQLAEKEVRENPALKDMKPAKAYAEAVMIVSQKRPDLVKVK